MIEVVRTHVRRCEGDQFAKKFGGANGDDPDWLKVTFTGWPPEGADVDELGAPVEELFETFQDEAIGAASFGQGHLVTLKGDDAGKQGCLGGQRSVGGNE